MGYIVTDKDKIEAHKYNETVLHLTIVIDGYAGLNPFHEKMFITSIPELEEFEAHDNWKLLGHNQYARDFTLAFKMVDESMPSVNEQLALLETGEIGWAVGTEHIRPDSIDFQYAIEMRPRLSTPIIRTSIHRETFADSTQDNFPRTKNMVILTDPLADIDPQAGGLRMPDETPDWVIKYTDLLNEESDGSEE